MRSPRLQRSTLSAILFNARSLAVLCLLAALVGGCAEEPQAADPETLPESVDLRRLRDAKLSGTACIFGAPARLNTPGSGRSTISFTCSPSEGRRMSGTVLVASALTGDEPTEDAVQCHVSYEERYRNHLCELQHGMVTIETLALCESAACSTENDSRELMARVVERLASLPEERCQLCAHFYPPERVAELTQRFSGRGPEELGTIDVQVDSTIMYVVPDQYILVRFGSPPRELVNGTGTGQQGWIDIPRGRYRKVMVDASGDWSLLIMPR